MGRVIDLWGCFEDFNDSPTAEMADRRGLYSDWQIVGQDLILAIGQEQERINAQQR
jgi:hypothetical protein